jgi:hypothetical protein
LVKSGQSGILKVYGTKALGIISFSNGKINGLKVGKYSGANAAKILAGWINFSTNFLTDGHFSETLKSVDTNSFLNLLHKSDTLLKKLKTVIPDKSSVFSLNNDAWLESSLTDIDQKVTMVIDGQKTVEQIVAETGVSEMELLKSMYKLHSVGMIYPANLEKSLTNDQTKEMIASLRSILTEITGAVGEVIVDRALIKINFDQSDFKKSQIPELMKVIHSYMDEDEKTILRKWEKDAEKILEEV